MIKTAALPAIEDRAFEESFLDSEFQNNGVMQMTDDEIVALYWDRNEKAISATSDNYGRFCAKIARNILRNEQETEECVNDTYMQAWEKIPPEKPKIFCAFIGKITRNLALDRYRRNHSAKRGGGTVELVLDELSECVSDGSSVEETAERREILEKIDRFLEKLPAKKRIIFVSRYCYCESMREIAARFGMTENSVTVSLSRTRADLRKHLLKEGYKL